jgi:hypothetical protein
MKKLFKGVTGNYLEKYHEQDSLKKILGTEVEFLILLDKGVYFTGTIDLVYEEDGKVYFSDHKFVSSLDMYEEKSKMDRQISRYWWALQMISKGIGRIKQKATNPDEQDMWVRWTELEGREISGFVYNLVAKDYPREPKILKKGGLSQDKSQKTTYDKYRAKIVELNLDALEYSDILEILKNKPDQFLRRVVVRRNQLELESSMLEFFYTTNDIHDTAMAIQMYPHKLDELTYRHIGTHCDHMCQFKAICQAAIAGENVQMVKNLAYKKNEER